MACGDVQQVLTPGIDYDLDLAIGRIKFLSTGVLGKPGFCGVRVDYDCPGVPHILCQSKIDDCLPCNDDPVLNISAEDFDSDRFLFNFNLRQRPRLGFTFQSVGCKRFCFSEVSQEDADLCAILQVTECINDGFRDETGPTIGNEPPFEVPQSPALFFNSAQTCTKFCPDGTSFGATIPAGRVADRNQAQANRIAFSLACRLAARRIVCILTKSLTPCLDSFYSKQLVATGGTGFRVTTTNIGVLSALCSPTVLLLNSSFPYIWSATGLPNGLSLSPCAGRITGTPTQVGNFNVTLRAQDSLGAFQTKMITLTVVEFTAAATLPDACQGRPYSHTLTINPAGTYFFQFSSGSPPSWLSLDSSTGQLTGTPDDSGEFMFEISVETPDGSLCEKLFTLSVAAAVDLGAITPNILASLPPTFWDGGNPQPPGRYRVRYENGAMQYAACSPDPCWSVNTVGAGFRILFSAGSPFPGTPFPASENTFLTQAAAEAANAGKFIDFETTVSAAISMRLQDSPYGDNQSGSPNPTFRLFRLCLT